MPSEEVTTEALAKRYAKIVIQQEPDGYEERYNVRRIEKVLGEDAIRFGIQVQLAKLVRRAEHPIKFRSGTDERGTNERELEMGQPDRRETGDRRSMRGLDPFRTNTSAGYIQQALIDGLEAAKEKGADVPENHRELVNQLVDRLRANADEELKKFKAESEHEIAPNQIGGEFKKLGVRIGNRANNVGTGQTAHLAPIIEALRNLRAMPSRG